MKVLLEYTEGFHSFPKALTGGIRGKRIQKLIDDQYDQIRQLKEYIRKTKDTFLLANLKTQLVENEVVRVRIPKCMAWLDDEPIRDPNTMKDKVDNPSPQSTPQVLPSFEVYTPPVTHPEEVEKTIGIPMEVEPLDHMKLEDLGLNTCSHDLFPSSKEFPSIDEPEPQPLPNLPFLDVNLGDKRGTYPPINPYTRFGLYLMRRSLEVLRKFHWMILGGRFNQLSHVSSPLLSKPGEY
ncbi:hypothetical protein Tco_0390951 [Tanacetum coccineum]